jgi:putative peptide zinc metalloprotease protein
MVFPRRVPIAGPKPPAPRRGRWEPARLLPLLLVFPAGSLLVPATTRSGVALDGGERLVLLLLLGLCVGIGLLMSRSQPVAVAAGAGLALALAPWPGAPSALPVALTATVLVVALGIDTVLRLPARWAPHTLLRVAVAAPLIVLVVVGGLFLPATAPRLPHAQLAAWITGPASGAGAVSVSPALWGQLVADGVPPGRLRLDEGEPEGPAAGNPAWTVTSGQPQSAARGAVSFGAGASTLSVRPSLQAPSGTHG